MNKKVALILIILFFCGIFILKISQNDASQLKPKGDGGGNNSSLPVMLELGSDRCVPCKMMEPVLEDLKHNYSDKFRVKFYDVWKNTEYAKKYDIEAIPTQIFLSVEGDELFRHTGFYSANEILQKWQQLGIEVETSNSIGQAGWLESLYSSFSSGIDSKYLLIALSASFVWGILSLLLSPCHLTSIPLVVGYINGHEEITTKRSFLISLFFSLGLLVSFLAVAIVTSWVGNMLGGIGKYFYYLLAVVFVLVGLHLLDLLPRFWSAPSGRFSRFKGLNAAFIIGLLFGIALGPCTFAYMAPVLAVSLKTAAANLFLSVFLIIVYGLGHCLIIIWASVFTGFLQKFLDAEKAVLPYLKKTIAIAVLAAGGYLLYSAPPIFT